MGFNKNMGTMDRILRLLTGVALIVLAGTGTIGLWGWLGLILVVTAFVRFCPLYAILGLCTAAKAKE